MKVGLHRRQQSRRNLRRAWEKQQDDKSHLYVNGFHVTFQDGFEADHPGGLISLPQEMIEEHGQVEKAEAF